MVASVRAELPLDLSRAAAIPGQVALSIVFAVAGAHLVFLAAWSAFGREYIVANRAGLQVKRSIFGFVFSSSEYQRGGITDLRVDPIIPFRPSVNSMIRRKTLSMGSQFGVGIGPVAFEFAGREVRIAEGLTRDSGETAKLFSSLSTALGAGAHLRSPDSEGGSPLDALGPDWEPFDVAE